MLKLRREKYPKLKWGAAGLGRFSETAFIPSLYLVRKAKLQSIFSNDANRSRSIAEKFSVPNHFNNYDEFLNSGIDVVYIGSANIHHYEQVIKAAEAGKHILCEKPLSITSAQAEEMVNVCRKNNVQLAVSYVYRFHPLIQKTKELIDSQLLGKIIAINTSFNINLTPDDNFRFSKALSGGGAVRDLGSHMIDLLRFFGGEINSIDGVMDNVVYKNEVEDFASGIVQFEKGGYGTFQVSYSSMKSLNRIEVIGHKGAVNIDNLVGQRYQSAKLSILLEGEARKAFRKRANKLYRLLSSINKAFRKNETPLVTGYDGLVNMKLIEQFELKCHSKKN
jgi:predicted dehydrogenase